MEKLQRSMTVYVKSLSKRNEGEDREKLLPVGFMGSTMIAHGQDFSHDSEFGNCLQSRLCQSISRNITLTTAQAWDAQTRPLLEDKRLTSRTPLRVGSSPSRDRWLK